MLTIGHSTRPVAEFVEMLRAHSVRALVDVRTVPRSRHNPQYNRETLPGVLAEAGIEYIHMPELGGLRHPRPDSPNMGWRNASFRGYADYMQTEAFTQALERLMAIDADRPAAVMCAESVPWRCHRSLIADALLARGIPVHHILSGPAARPHVMTPFAHREGARLFYPPE